MLPNKFVHFDYEDLPTQNEQGQTLEIPEVKKLRYAQIKTGAYYIYKTDDWNEAIERLGCFVQTWQPLEPKAIRSFLKDIGLTFSFYDCQPSLYPLVRTTNALERLFREFRTKSDEIGAFPNQDSCLTIFTLQGIVDIQQTASDRCLNYTAAAVGTGLAMSQIATSVIVAKNDPKTETGYFFQSHAFQYSVGATFIVAGLVGLIWFLLFRRIAR